MNPNQQATPAQAAGDAYETFSGLPQLSCNPDDVSSDEMNGVS